MPLLSVRCTEAEKAELDVRGHGNTSRYIRQRLFETTDQDDLLYQILEQVSEGHSEASAGLSRRDMGLLVELLLLMRAAVKPNARNEAQAEVERIGLEVWTSESATTKR